MSQYRIRLQVCRIVPDQSGRVHACENVLPERAGRTCSLSLWPECAARARSRNSWSDMHHYGVNCGADAPSGGGGIDPAPGLIPAPGPAPSGGGPGGVDPSLDALLVPRMP